jgi:hypothetical protein
MEGQRRSPAANSTLAIGGVPSPLDSFEVAESSVLRTNFCAKSPPIANLQNVSSNAPSTLGRKTTRKKIILDMLSN